MECWYKINQPCTSGVPALSLSLWVLTHYSSAVLKLCSKKNQDKWYRFISFCSTRLNIPHLPSPPPSPPPPFPSHEFSQVRFALWKHTNEWNGCFVLDGLPPPPSPPPPLQLRDGETEQITITQITTNIRLHWQQKQTWKKFILDLLKWSSKKVLKQKKLITFLSFSLLSGELPLIWIPQKSAVSFQTGSRTVVFFRLSCLFELAFLFSDSSW